MGFVVFGVVVFGLVVFGLVPLGLVSLGVPLGFVVPGFGLVVFGFVVPGLPVFGLLFGFVVPGFVVPGVVPVGGFTEPVGGLVAPGVVAWPLCPGAAPLGAEPAVPAPPGAACATIHVPHSRTTESNVTFFIDMIQSLQD